MNALASPWPAFDQFLETLKRENRGSIANRSGLSYFILRAALNGRSVLAVCEEERMDAMHDDFKALASAFEVLSAWSVGVIPLDSPSEKNARLEESLHSKGLVWFVTKESILEPALTKSELEESRLVLKVGKTLPYQKFVEHISIQGYERAPFVEAVGEFSIRGEVLDFWSPNYATPVRLIFMNDVIESLHFFEPGEQRTLTFVPEVVLVPCRKATMDNTILDYLPEDAIILDNAEAALETKFPLVSVLPSGLDLGVAPATPVRLQWNLFKKELEENSLKGIQDIVFCRNTGEAQRLEDHLEDLRIKKPFWPAVLIGPLNEGFRAVESKISVWSFREMVGGPPPARRLPKFRSGRLLDSIIEISAGDFVVHENFGIGRYRGLERMSFKRGLETEFLHLEFRGGDKLYVPIQEFRLVQKYVGAEGKRPPLSSLDRAAWERMKEKVRKEVADLARELLKTAATREALRRPGGMASLENRPVEHLMREFEEAFPYEETPDQEEAIRKVMLDLEGDKLMDHLVCGDVGYGKTEIAMRAAFRAVCDGKQVAVLVPTTILAEQHFKTFTARFADFPVKIGMLSRFQDKREQQKVIEDLKIGVYDILIGTHRLIQKDVFFKDLGLVIIDEEHRFGVKQKERLKQMTLHTDILALSATPIPRTLSLAMGGIRNVSVVESPPEGRLPIETTVGLFDKEAIKTAVQRELERGGQVFYVHNRISTIHKRKEFLEGLFPGIRIGIAHGQMTADNLEEAMWNFLHKKWDILLSTTIIESGLDIPSVNTLIVEDSEDFGLSQLYQLRGRVGRQRQKAYCLLFFSDWAKLSQDARKRLSAIQEFSALGSGMKLALRDMEIRGTGNLLGSQQHGFIAAIGLDLYCQLLSEEATKVKSGDRDVEDIQLEEEAAPEIDLEVSAFIPESYVDHPGERISLYKKMLAAKSTENLGAIQAELQDRFGPYPSEVQNLVGIMSLRLEAKKNHVSSIAQTSRGLIISWLIKEKHQHLDLASFAKGYPRLIEILPPDIGQKGPEAIRILFNEDVTEPFFQANKFLQLGSSFVTINPYAKK